MHRTRVITALLAVVALSLAACGSSSSSRSTPAAVAAPSSPSPSNSTPSTTPAALITTKHAGKLGTILAVGPKKLTVYLFESDRGSSSSCSGTCARVWPPVLGSPKAAAGAMSADLGTITRSDGSKQVTYKGHPLYLYIKDKDDGDTYGEGVKSFGAPWYALAPSGSKVDLS